MSNETNFLEDVIDAFGDTVLVNVEDVGDVIPTGSVSMDVSIGVGGIPRGKITEVYGPEGSGKTTLALSIVKKALQSGLKALYIDVENMLDYNLIKAMIGEDLNQEQFIILNPETAEDAFSMAEMGIANKSFALVVIDSIGAMAPLKEKTDNFADANVALLPRLLSKFLRRNASSIASNNIAFLCLNQVRDKIGAYISSYETPGGHALKHFSAVRIQLSKGVDLKVGNEKVGINSKFTIKKNKLSAPFRSYTMPIIFGKGIDEYADAVDFCTLMGAIKQKGSYYYFGEEKLGQGKLSAAEYLEKRPKTLDKIKEMMYNILNQYTSVDTETLEKEKEEEKDE